MGTFHTRIRFRGTTQADWGDLHPNGRGASLGLRREFSVGLRHAMFSLIVFRLFHGIEANSDVTIYSGRNDTVYLDISDKIKSLTLACPKRSNTLPGSVLR